jgi:hypothetical protein
MGFPSGPSTTLSIAAFYRIFKEPITRWFFMVDGGIFVLIEPLLEFIVLLQD